MNPSNITRLLGILSLLAALSLTHRAAAETGKIIESDICIYGGTSGGVAAAVQAARMGKSVVIAEPGRHLGGMTSGGLSAVDIGEPRSVGGIAREYFTKLAATVGVTLAWDKEFKAAGGGPATGGAYAIEPHKAEQVFNDMVREAGVKVHFQARLAAVKKDGARITEIVTEDGTVFRAKVFMDTTYEGDLMAKAGVSYTLMREGNAKYDETYNGIHYTEKYLPRTNHLKPGPHGRVPGGQGVWDRDFPLDPYVVKGDPKSGLLPLIQAGEPGTQGDPAPGVQAYCFRLCLTTNPANRIPISPPADYDPKRYEIVARFIEASLAIGDDMDLRWFSKHDPLPNDKWDFNTATFGGNLPGASHAWPEATYAERKKIAKAHEDYHRGLLHFLATDPRVPEKVRGEMRRFGLPKDEFTDNGGWPHQIYVREARRMVGDLVLTEHHTFGRKAAPKSIALGSYGTDTHEIRRIVKDGVVIREGKTATGRDGAPPYAIGYDAIVPKQSECENLFVTFALSASHTAFSSIRMEPVFMCSSQSAATAAVLAIENEVPVQGVDYDKLRARLEQDGQVLRWPPPPPLKGAQAAPPRFIPAQEVESIPGLIAFWDFQEAAGQLRISSGPQRLALQENRGPIEQHAGGVFGPSSARIKRGQWFMIPRSDIGPLNLHGKDAQVTVAAWVRREDKSSWQAIAGVWDETHKKRQYCLFLNAPRGTRADEMKRYPLANRIHGHVSAIGGPTPGEKFCITYSSGATEIPPGDWHCLAMTYDGLASRVYVDGKLDALDHYNPFPYADGLFDGGADGADFTVGAVHRGGEWGNFFGGQISGLAVFSRALSDAEMLKLGSPRE
jgi:hypothetical protein